MGMKNESNIMERESKWSFALPFCNADL